MLRTIVLLASALPLLGFLGMRWRWNRYRREADRRLLRRAAERGEARKYC